MSEPSGPLRIGILALQGDFDKHADAIRDAAAEPVPIRTKTGLETVDALILPGGESSTMLRLLDYEHLFEPLRQFGKNKPIFGTCAGAILLAADVSHPQQASLNLVDLSVQRNGYGRQIDSRVAKIEVDGQGTMEAVFIRAPVIRRVGAAVRVLARYDEMPVLVEEGRHLAATFHPELTADGRIHRYFVEKVRSGKN
ncbi:MAG: pyridoxal 5'-phosphate synthase glutaminase subunit PdxT [Rhodospirillales bacterium]|nr:pyridoxal 5'-phosphate synthase glutaminase subunit PdxT [Acetobacter sp.]